MSCELWPTACVCVCVRFASDCAACVRAVQLMCVLFCHCVVCVCCASVCCASVLCHLCAVCAAQQQHMCVWLCAAVRAACDKVKLCHLCVCVLGSSRDRECVAVCSVLDFLLAFSFINSYRARATH